MFAQNFCSVCREHFRAKQNRVKSMQKRFLKQANLCKNIPHTIPRTVSCGDDSSFLDQEMTLTVIVQ
jgi:hypothetical protein